MKAINPFSATSTQIEMLFNDTKLSVGTAFFFRHGGVVYLVTNWHNVSGKNNQTLKHLSPTLAEPNKILYRIFEEGDPNRPVQVSIDLYQHDRPVWLEHPHHKHNVDVVCIPLGNLPEIICVNDLATRDPFLPFVSSEVFILGYPRGISTFGFPIWKKGSIASEPAIDVDSLPLFLVDTASSPGMSGSPVLLKASAGSKASGIEVLAGPDEVSLLGVYSGRLKTDDPNDAQIGRVWKHEVISEIINPWGR